MKYDDSVSRLSTLIRAQGYRGRREWVCLFQVLHSHIRYAKRICLRSSSKWETRYVHSTILKVASYNQDNPTLPECLFWSWPVCIVFSCRKSGLSSCEAWAASRATVRVSGAKFEQRLSERMSIVEIKLGLMITVGLALSGCLETEVQSVGNIDVEVLPWTCSSIQVHRSPRTHHQSFWKFGDPKYGHGELWLIGKEVIEGGDTWKRHEVIEKKAIEGGDTWKRHEVMCIEVSYRRIEEVCTDVPTVFMISLSVFTTTSPIKKSPYTNCVVECNQKHTVVTALDSLVCEWQRPLLQETVWGWPVVSVEGGVVIILIITCYSDCQEIETYILRSLPVKNRH